MERYFYDTTGVDEAAETAIARKAFEVAGNLDVNTITFYVQTFDNVGWIARMFGQNSPRQLREGFNQDGIVLNLHSLRTFNDYGDNCILVALGQNSETLFELECVPRIRAMLALPWVQDECLDWASNLGAYDLNSEETFERFTLPCVVERAFEQLTGAINLGTGITHPNDERRAKTYIRALHRYEYELNVHAIKAYLVENNWTKNGMNSIADLINTVNEGRYFQGGETTGLHHHRDRWEEDCAEI